MMYIYVFVNALHVPSNSYQNVVAMLGKPSIERHGFTNIINAVFDGRIEEIMGTNDNIKYELPDYILLSEAGKEGEYIYD